MKHAEQADRLRAQLADLIAAPGPMGMRGLRIWHVAEEISALTDERVSDILAKATREAAKRLGAQQ